MTDHLQIDFNIIKEILNLAKSKAMKSGNKNTTLDLVTILQAYGDVLETQQINQSEDTVYYKFLLDLSVAHNKQQNGDWVGCFEKLKKKYQLKRIAALHYYRTLCQKSFMGMIKYKIICCQSAQESFPDGCNFNDVISGSSPIFQARQSTNSNIVPPNYHLPSQQISNTQSSRRMSCSRMPTLPDNLSNIKARPSQREQMGAMYNDQQQQYQQNYHPQQQQQQQQQQGVTDNRSDTLLNRTLLSYSPSKQTDISKALWFKELQQSILEDCPPRDGTPEYQGPPSQQYQNQNFTSQTETLSMDITSKPPTLSRNSIAQSSSQLDLNSVRPQKQKDQLKKKSQANLSTQVPKSTSSRGNNSRTGSRTNSRKNSASNRSLSKTNRSSSKQAAEKENRKPNKKSLKINIKSPNGQAGKEQQQQQYQPQSDSTNVSPKRTQSTSNRQALIQQTFNTTGKKFKSPTHEQTTAATMINIDENGNPIFTPFLGNGDKFVQMTGQDEGTTQNEVNKTFDFHNLTKSIEVQVNETDIQRSFKLNKINQTMDEQETRQNETDFALMTFLNQGSGKKAYQDLQQQYNQQDSRISTLEDASFERSLVKKLNTDADDTLTRQEYVQMLREYQTNRKQENLKLLNEMFTKWAIYVRQKVQKKKSKDDLIQKAVKAMDIYYTNLLTKSFVTLGLKAIANRRYKKNFQIIQSAKNKKLISKYFALYRKRYETSVIEGMIEHKADKFYQKKQIARQGGGANNIKYEQLD